jgi:hypothetical protein
VFGGPAGHCITIVAGCGKSVFRRQSIVDRHDDAARSAAEIPTQAVVSFDVTDHEATAVEEYEDGERPVALRCVEPDRNADVREFDGSILDSRDFGLLAAPESSLGEPNDGSQESYEQ